MLIQNHQIRHLNQILLVNEQALDLLAALYSVAYACSAVTEDFPEWLSQAVLPGQDNQLLDSELELLEVLKRKISESNGIVKELARGDKRVKLLRSIPGIGPYCWVVEPLRLLLKISDIFP